MFSVWLRNRVQHEHRFGVEWTVAQDSDDLLDAWRKHPDLCSDNVHVSYCKQYSAIEYILQGGRGVLDTRFSGRDAARDAHKVLLVELLYLVVYGGNPKLDD